MKTIHTKTLIKRKSSEISLELIYLAVEHLIHSLQQGRRAQPDPPRDAINSLCSSASPSKHFTFNPSLQNLTTQAGTAAGLAPRSAARAAPGVLRGKDDTFPHLTFLCLHLTFLFPTGARGRPGWRVDEDARPRQGHVGLLLDKSDGGVEEAATRLRPGEEATATPDELLQQRPPTEDLGGERGAGTGDLTPRRLVTTRPCSAGGCGSLGHGRTGQSRRLVSRRAPRL